MLFQGGIIGGEVVDLTLGFKMIAQTYTPVATVKKKLNLFRKNMSFMSDNTPLHLAKKLMNILIKSISKKRTFIKFDHNLNEGSLH